MKERAIFDAALAFDDPAERDAYLDRECGRNSLLRRRVVNLLAALPKLNSFLESPATPASNPPEGSAKPGDVIGHYKLLQQVGEGGFGIVYMAEQQYPVRRKVALKIIKAGMDSREVITRFEAERQALAMMDHPNISRVLEAGTTDSGRPYFVMDLVRGSPITEYCDQNHLTLSERLKLFVPVCRAIQHAHQKGVIHRDIKPSNVLITSADGEPAPKVIDFGVAKAIDHRLTERTMFTRFGQVVGTLEYMSPEQAEMGGLDIDTRSDVYSLGVLLYELLTGSTPLQRARLKNAAFDEVLRMIREEEPATPSNRISQSGDDLPVISAHRCMEPKKLGAFVRGELDWVVMKALEKNRSRRFSTANEFADDIEHFLRGEPVTACPPSWTYRLGKFARKHTGLIAGTLFFLIVLLIAAPVSIWQAVQATKAKVVAGIERDEARKANYQARISRDAEVKARVELEQAYKLLTAEQTKTSEAHARAIRNEARLAAEKGHGLVEQGRAREGLLWLMRAFNNMPPQEASQRSAIRYNIASVWDNVLKPVIATPPSTIMNNVGPDGRLLSWEPDEEAKVGGGPGKSGEAPKGPPYPFRIHIWNADATNSIVLSRRLSGRPHLLGLSPKGKLLSITNPQQLDRWEIDSGSVGEPIALHAAGPGAAFLHPNGSRLVSISEDRRRVQLTDTESGAVLSEVSVSEPSYLAVPSAGSGPFSPDGFAVALIEFTSEANAGPPDQASLTVVIHRLEAANGALLGKSKLLKVTEPSSRSLRLAIGPRADSLIVVKADEKTGQSAFQQYDAVSGTAIGAPWGDASTLGKWAISPDGLLMATTTPQSSLNAVLLELWQLLPERQRIGEVTFKGHVEKLRFDANGSQLYTIGNCPVLCWSVPQTQLRHAMYPHAYPIQAVALRHDETVLSVSGRQLHRWKMSTGELMSPPIELPLKVDGRVPSAFSADGRMYAVADGALISCWDTNSGQPIGRSIMAPGEIMKISFDQAGTRLLCVCATDKTKGEAHVIDVASGARIGSPVAFLCIFDWLPKQKGMVQGAVAISPNGKEILATESFMRLKSWDPVHSKPDSEIEASGALTDTRYTPDGRHILTCVGNQSIEVIDVATRKRIGQRITLKKPLRAFAVTPDSQVLATAIDGEVRFWFLETGQTLGRPLLHNKVTTLCFSSDGESLIAGDELGLVRVWSAFRHLPEEDLVASIGDAVRGLQLSDSGSTEHVESIPWQHRVPTSKKSAPQDISYSTPVLKATLNCQSPSDWQQASATLNWLAEQPQGWMGRLLRARCYLDTEQPDLAQAEVKRALEIRPASQVVAWLKNLAWQEMYRRQPDRARWYLDRIVESDLADADVYLAQAGLCVAENRRGEANSWLQRIIDSQPTTTTVFRSVGEIDFRLGNWESAAGRFARALELGGGNAEVWQRRATCYAELGRWDQAAEDMDKAVQRHPRNMEWRDRLAIALVSAGNLNSYRELCADTIANMDLKDAAIRPWNVPPLLALAADGLSDYGPIVKLGFEFEKAYPAQASCVCYRIFGPYGYRAGEYERSAGAAPPPHMAMRFDEIIFRAMAMAKSGDVPGANEKLAEVTNQPWQRLEVWERQRVRLLLAEAEQVLSAAQTETTEPKAP